MWAGPTVAGTHPFFFVIINDRKPLVTADGDAFYHLNISEVIVFRCPAVAVVNFDMAGGCFDDSSSRGSGHPRVGGIFPDLHADMRCKIRRAAHVEVMRAASFAARTVIESIHRNP